MPIERALLVVYAPHFVGAVVWIRMDGKEWEFDRACPILKWTKDKTVTEILSYLNSKGYQHKWIDL